MKNTVAEKAMKLITTAFSESEYIFDIDVENSIHEISDPKNGFLSEFFHIETEKINELITEATSDFTIQRYFIGMGPDADQHVKDMYHECVRDIERLESLPTAEERIDAERKIAEKYDGHLIYKSDDAISLIATYKTLTHPTEDYEKYKECCKKTKRILSKHSIEDLGSDEKVREACKASRTKYDSEWAKGIVFISRLKNS